MTIHELKATNSRSPFCPYTIHMNGELCLFVKRPDYLSFKPGTVTYFEPGAASAFILSKDHIASVDFGDEYTFSGDDWQINVIDLP